MSIVIRNLNKTYSKNVNALQDVTLEINLGMFGLLGPNGAGKTTLMRIISTLVRPTSGIVKVCGYQVDDPSDKWAIRDLIGYLPQELSLYNDLTAYEFLEFVGTLKKISGKRNKRENIQNVLEITNLVSVAHKRIKTYSGGMKRRVGIAQALLGDPAVLIIDEPTAGLDPHERVRFRNLLVQLASDRLVLLSSHIVEDISQTCSRLAVLDQGELLFNDDLSHLMSHAEGKVWEFISKDYQPDPNAFIVANLQTPEGLKYRVLSDEQPHTSATRIRPNLEDSYLYLIRNPHSTFR